jgi:preprotein translocase subunit SecE
VASKVDKAKKEEKKTVRKQPNFIVRYFNETIGELRKVSWPTRKDAISLTVIVLIVTFSMSLFRGLLDLLYTRFFALLFV